MKVMKKIGLLLTAALVMSFAACSSDSDNDTTVPGGISVVDKKGATLSGTDLIINKAVHLKNFKLEKDSVLAVNVSGCTLENVSVDGSSTGTANPKIVAAAGIKDGDLSIINCGDETDKIDIEILGGGSNSIHLDNVIAAVIKIAKSCVRIVADGAVKAASVSVEKSGAKIEAADAGKIEVEELKVDESVGLIKIAAGEFAKIDAAASSIVNITSAAVKVESVEEGTKLAVNEDVKESFAQNNSSVSGAVETADAAAISSSEAEAEKENSGKPSDEEENTTAGAKLPEPVGVNPFAGSSYVVHYSNETGYLSFTESELKDGDFVYRYSYDTTKNEVYAILISCKMGEKTYTSKAQVAEDAVSLSELTGGEIPVDMFTDTNSELYKKMLTFDVVDVRPYTISDDSLTIYRPMKDKNVEYTKIVNPIEGVELPESVGDNPFADSSYVVHYSNETGYLSFTESELIDDDFVYRYSYDTTKNEVYAILISCKMGEKTYTSKAQVAEDAVSLSELTGGEIPVDMFTDTNSELYKKMLTFDVVDVRPYTISDDSLTIYRPMKDKYVTYTKQ